MRPCVGDGMDVLRQTPSPTACTDSEDDEGSDGVAKSSLEAVWSEAKMPAVRIRSNDGVNDITLSMVYKSKAS